MKKYNVITSIILILVGVLVIFNSQHFPDTINNNTPGPGFWPSILGWGLGLTSTGLLITSLLNKNPDTEDPIKWKSAGFKQILKLAVVLGLFGIGLKYLGFFPSSLAFIVAVMLIMGERDWKTILVATVAITLCIYIIFALLLGLILPKGKLF